MNGTPTQAELAALAATLATGREVTVEDFIVLAERALAIWDAAGQVLAPRSPRHSSKFAAEFYLPFERAGIKPPEMGQHFTFIDGLAYVMAKKSKTDRVKFFRDYLTYLCECDPDSCALLFTGEEVRNPDGIVIPPEKQVETTMKDFREKGFSFSQMRRLADGFLPWLKDDAKRKRAEAGRAGGKARAAKGRVKPAKKQPER
jgi:hypothetical protein